MKKWISISIFWMLLLSHGQAQQQLAIEELKAVKLENLSVINTTHHESSAFWIGNDSLVYVKFKQRSKEDNPTRGEQIFDLYLATKMGTDFIVKKSLSGTINSNYVEGPGDYDEEGRRLFFTRSYKSSNTSKDEKSIIKLKIFESIRMGDKWSSPKVLSGLEADFNYCHPAYDKESKRLYFSADIPGGFGGMDLYYSIESADGLWSVPINLGPAVNSSANEVFPTIIASNLFYSSSATGNLDLWMSIVSDGQFSTPTSLPTTINSDRDDFGLIKQGDLYYFSSNRSGGKGKDDLYRFSMSSDLLKEALPDSTIVSVLVYDQNNKPLPDANVSISKIALPTDSEKDIKLDSDNKITFSYDLSEHSQLLVPTLPLSGEGSGYVILREGVQYLFTAKSDKHQDISQILDLQKGKSSIAIKMNTKASNTTVISSPPVKNTRPIINIPIEKGAVIVFENIYYDYNSDNLQAGATTELDALADVMRANPGIKVQLSSHTDSRGRELYNQDLSDRRAASAKRYLRNKGISASRIFDIGFGESRIRNHCTNGVKCSEDEHKFNRRTEVKIIEN